jgi:hypothetical protein
MGTSSSTSIAGSPPRLTIPAAGDTGRTAEGTGREVTFEGDLSRCRTTEERREQASLRQWLFAGADTAACALCGQD